MAKADKFTLGLDVRIRIYPLLQQFPYHSGGNVMRMLLFRTNKVKSSVKTSFIKPKRALITAVIALGIMAMTKLRPLPYSIKSIKGTRLLAVLVALFLFSQIFQMAGVGRNLKNSQWIANADANPFTRRQPTS